MTDFSLTPSFKIQRPADTGNGWLGRFFRAMALRHASPATSPERVETILRVRAELEKERRKIDRLLMYK